MSKFSYIWNLFSSDREATSANSATHTAASLKLITASNFQTEKVLSWLSVPEGGLTQEEAERRLKQYGPNQIAHEKSVAWYNLLYHAFRNPFVLVLIILGVISYVTKDYKATIVMSIMVSISVGLRFVQEFRSTRAALKLKAMVSTTVTVLRNYPETQDDETLLLKKKELELPFEEVVPGDIVRLSAGDMVPADIRLLSSKDLFISQAALTGEAIPVEKEVELGVEPKRSHNPLDRRNLCFLGSDVISGSAIAVVVNTGSSTFFGSLAQSIVGQRPITSFDKGVSKVSWILIRFMAIMVPIVFFINGYTKGDWQEAFLFAVAVAVGLTPEMLPMIVTTNLAKGAVSMAKEKVVVKYINAIQNLGAMDILCTDKTGTLTQDKIVLLNHLDIYGKESAMVLEQAFINSYYQTGLKNLLDRAVLEFVELATKLQIPDIHKVDEIPFDFTRRRMSVVVEQAGSEQLICKGAIEEILKVCSRVESNGGVVVLTPEIRNQVLELTRNLNEDGLRIIAVAYKKGEPKNSAYTVSDESDLVLSGFIGFLDPPKESAAPAIRELINDGVQVKILTGDNELVTQHICKVVGLDIKGIVKGDEIEGLSEKELADLAELTTIFAKVSPDQKARIIRALKTKGHTIGYMGDGINDAPALREADVGISVDTAADIAKESSDIILLEKSLLVLKTGVIKGRQVYGNIIKYIKMTASSNFGNVLSVMAASIFVPFLPMLPIHLLIQNLCYDFSQITIPWDTMSKSFLAKPRKWDTSGVARFMLLIGPVSSVFDILTFLILWFVFKANSIEHQSLFQSGWFVEGLLSQTLIVHIIRTAKIPFFQSMASIPVLVSTITVMIIGVAIPFSPLGHAVGMTSLPLSYFSWLFGILLGYFILAQVVKSWYINRFHSWL